MKKIVINNKLLFFLVIFISVSLSSYHCRNSFALYKSNINTRLKYSSVIKRLTFYKKELSLISSKISRSNSAVINLKKKIKNDENQIKKTKKKIKKYGMLIKNLTEKIFIINKEYRLDGIMSFKNESNAYIINYQLKILLKKEEEKLLKLIKRKNKFLILKKYLKNEKNSLIGDVKGINRSKKRLKQLIAGLNIYIKSLKIKNNEDYNGYQSKKPENMSRDNKKNRLLKRKVIKLIKNLKNKSRNSGVIFQIIK